MKDDIKNKILENKKNYYDKKEQEKQDYDKRGNLDNQDYEEFQKHIAKLRAMKEFNARNSK